MAENSADYPPPKNPKIPRRQSSAGSEVDLWNMDDDLPTGDSLTPLPEVTSSPQVDDDIVRIEKGTLNRSQHGMKPPRQSRVNEIASPRISEAPAAIEKEKSKPSPAPFKNPSKSIGPTEDEVWADFGEDVAPSISDQPITPPVTRTPEKIQDSSPIRSLDLSHKAPAKKAPLVSRPAKVIAPIDTPAPDAMPEVSKQVPSPAPVESYDTPPSFSEDTVVSSPAAAPPSLQITKFSRLEVIASLSFLFLLIAGGFIGLKLFHSNVKPQEDLYAEPKFPMNGAIAHVANATTYWRAPIKDGPNADPTQRDITLIPVIDLTLDEKKSESGVIRVMFYNDEGAIVGDIVTREFKNHRFEINGSSTLSFASTSGFTNFGEQEAYRANLTKPWTIKVFEGPNINAPSSSFLLLFSTPISTKRH